MAHHNHITQNGPLGGDYARQHCQSAYSKGNESVLPYLKEIYAFPGISDHLMNKNVCYAQVTLVLVIFPFGLAKTSMEGAKNVSTQENLGKHHAFTEKVKVTISKCKNESERT